MTDIVIDFETLSLSTDKPVVISMGWAVFDKKRGILDSGKHNIEVRECIDTFGGNIDLDTLLWWLKLNPEALMNQLEGTDYTISEAIDTLITKANGCINSWSHGKEFDLVILDTLIGATTRAIPRYQAFHYSNQMDTRTLFKLAGLDWRTWVNNHSLGDKAHDPEVDCIMLAEAILYAKDSIATGVPILTNPEEDEGCPF